MKGRYQPITITELPDASRQGYSIVLNLNLRWVNGQLFWIDPATGQRHPHLRGPKSALHDSERNRAGRVPKPSSGLSATPESRLRPASVNWN